MRSSVLVLVACVFAVSLSARADDATEAFRRMCLATHSDAAQALAEADHEGWMALPEPMLKEFEKTQFSHAQGRIRSTSSDLYILILGTGRPSQAVSIDMQLCGVAEVPGAPEEFEAQGAALAGVPKDTSFSTDKSFYVWREENGRRIAVTRNDPKAMSLILGGGLTFLVTYSEEKKMSIIMLAVPAAAKPETGKP